MTWVELVPNRPVAFNYGPNMSLAGIPISPASFCCYSFVPMFRSCYYFLLNDTDLVALRLAGIDLRLAEPGEWVELGGT